MIKKAVRTCRGLVHFLTGSLAAVFLLCGLLSLLCTFRVGARAFASHDLIRYKPDTADAKPGLDEIAEINPDAAAWLTIYDTHIDYPVFRGRSDMEYINKDAYGNHSISGSVFLSVMNRKDFSEPYQIIYGHNMENGSMFGDIDEFKDERFFYSNSKKSRGLLITENEVFDLYIFAILKTDAYDPVIYKADKTEGEIGDLLSYIKEKSLYSLDENGADHIIALSTCDGGGSLGRNVLLCKAMKRTEPIETKDEVKRRHEAISTFEPSKEGTIAYLDIVLLIVVVYLAFPVHVYRQTALKDGSSINIIILLSAAFSLTVFILTEDLDGSLEVISRETPLMIVAAASSWFMRSYKYRKENRHPIERIEYEKEKN